MMRWNTETMGNDDDRSRILRVRGREEWLLHGMLDTMHGLNQRAKRKPLMPWDKRP